MEELIVHMAVVGMDIDKLEKEFERAIEDGMDELSGRIEDEWRRVANEELHQSREQYLDAISVENVGGVVQASLNGFLAVSVEEGREAYDMKPGMLGSKALRVVPIGKRAGESPRFTPLTINSRGWRHPGFKPRRLLEKVMEVVDEKLKQEVFGETISRIIA